MSIVVSCQCGKKFKAKDHMAGKKVRCPACKDPVRIPGGGGKSATGGKKPVDAEDALLRFEEAQKKKAIDAEAEAQREKERQALIASYDQMTGRSQKEKKKKDELAEAGVPKKPTAVNKAADAGASVMTTMIGRYVLIVLLVGVGIWGSVSLFRLVINYADDSTAVKETVAKQVKDLQKQTFAHINLKELDLAEQKLNKILEIDPSKKGSRTIQILTEKLESAKAEAKAEAQAEADSEAEADNGPA